MRRNCRVRRRPQGARRAQAASWSPRPEYQDCNRHAEPGLRAVNAIERAGLRRGQGASAHRAKRMRVGRAERARSAAGPRARSGHQPSDPAHNAIN
ncbi:hypothetical protein NDU88_005889 [Pleurodeles waltl]|uniref:Uncharacterized protein n=1 Tax=Pleurodeles waltl TaxID=8319 RepID=A0AAV7N2H6_PLEWA|nr:hypothetical protein NDU88_005889 [Pleurodeles waltl]